MISFLLNLPGLPFFKLVSVRRGIVHCLMGLGGLKAAGRVLRVSCATPLLGSMLGGLAVAAASVAAAQVCLDLKTLRLFLIYSSPTPHFWNFWKLWELHRVIQNKMHVKEHLGMNLWFNGMQVSFTVRGMWEHNSKKQKQKFISTESVWFHAMFGLIAFKVSWS